MKKIIAISVMLVLIAGAAFAQPAIGGQFKAGATLLVGNTIDNDESVKAAGRYPQNGTEGFLNAKFGDEEVGGYARFFAKTSGDYHSPGAFAFAWWKPSDSLRLQIGSNPDADWGAAKITGWGFLGEAQDYVALDQDSGEWRSYGNGDIAEAEGGHSTWMYGSRSWGFYPGIKSRDSFLMAITPAEGVAINIGVPFGVGVGGDGNGVNSKSAKNQYLSSHLQVAYTIQDTGTLTISYEGKGTVGAGDDEKVESPKVYASFNVIAIEGIGLDIGVAFQPETQAKVTPPIEAGLGFTYSADDFGVKLRVGASLAGKNAAGVKDPTQISVGILPFYKMEIFTFFFNAGLGMVIPESGDGITGWFVNPYIAKSAGGAKIFAGFKLYSAGKISLDPAHPADATMHWSVPIGINFYF